MQRGVVETENVPQFIDSPSLRSALRTSRCAPGDDQLWAGIVDHIDELANDSIAFSEPLHSPVRQFSSSPIHIQTTSAKVCSIRLKYQRPPTSKARTAPTETAMRGPGACVCPSSAHRKPSTTPTIGFKP